MDIQTIDIDPCGLAQVGDVAFFRMSGTTWPNHAFVVTQVDASANVTHAFGAWDDTIRHDDRP